MAHSLDDEERQFSRRVRDIRAHTASAFEEVDLDDLERGRRIQGGRGGSGIVSGRERQGGVRAERIKNAEDVDSDEQTVYISRSSDRNKGTGKSNGSSVSGIKEAEGGNHTQRDGVLEGEEEVAFDARDVSSRSRHPPTSAPHSTSAHRNMYKMNSSKTTSSSPLSSSTPRPTKIGHNHSTTMTEDVEDLEALNRLRPLPPSSTSAGSKSSGTNASTRNTTIRKPTTSIHSPATTTSARMTKSNGNATPKEKEEAKSVTRPSLPPSDSTVATSSAISSPPSSIPSSSNPSTQRTPQKGKEGTMVTKVSDDDRGQGARKGVNDVAKGTAEEGHVEEGEEYDNHPVLRLRPEDIDKEMARTEEGGEG